MMTSLRLTFFCAKSRQTFYQFMYFMKTFYCERNFWHQNQRDRIEPLCWNYIRETTALTTTSWLTAASAATTHWDSGSISQAGIDQDVLTDKKERFQSGGRSRLVRPGQHQPSRMLQTGSSRSARLRSASFVPMLTAFPAAAGPLKMILFTSLQHNTFGMFQIFNEWTQRFEQNQTCSLRRSLL